MGKERYEMKYLTELNVSLDFKDLLYSDQILTFRANIQDNVTSTRNPLT